MGAGFGNTLAGDPIALIAVLAVLAVFAWALYSVRKMAKDDLSSRRRIAELEIRLNEAETAIASEAHILIIWNGRSDQPDRIVGSMHGAARLPSEPEALLDFSHWLERDSTMALIESLHELRTSGSPFNIGIRTLANELLEADGRTAGGLAMLRFRPLAGERRNVAALAYDAHKLGKQVERLSAVLDAAPLPVWLRGTDGKLVWVNQAYVASVEAPNEDVVVKAGIEIATHASLDKTRANPKTGCAGRIHAVIGGAMRALDIHEIALADGIAGFAIDMTMLEEAEKELDRHIKAHTSTLNKLDTAIAIFGPDQRLRFYNAAYALLWPLELELARHPSDR